MSAPHTARGDDYARSLYGCSDFGWSGSAVVGSMTGGSIQLGLTREEAKALVTATARHARPRPGAPPCPRNLRDGEQVEGLFPVLRHMRGNPRADPSPELS